MEPAVAEHTEMYLKAIWLLDEAGHRLAHIKTISKLLEVAPPSAVEMLRKLEQEGCVKYLPRRGVEMTDKGRKVGTRLVRNQRLFESLMRDKLRIAIDMKIACGIEHHLTEEFADALCTFLGHPRECPHGRSIPKGSCCKKSLQA